MDTKQHKRTADERRYTRMRWDRLVQFLEFPQFWANRTLIELPGKLLHLNDGHPELIADCAGIDSSKPTPSASICVHLRFVCVFFAYIRVHSRSPFVSIRGPHSRL
jgi:hypothetical protein